MTDKASTATSSAAATNRMRNNPTEAKKMLRADIGSRWARFSTRELTDLKDNDDLVSQLVAKYGLQKDAAQRDAAAIVYGRAF